MSAYEQNSAKVTIPDAKSLGLPVYKDDKLYLTVASTDDSSELYDIFKDVLLDGTTYPQESMTKKEFEGYFYSHYTFVVKQTSDTGSADKVLAGFYIKPNFPSRSSHLANYGLIVDKEARGKGIGNFMVQHCIRLANLLGFKALYTNLVYVTNTASIKACLRYGFVQVGRVPKAGFLKGLGYVDALQFYKDVTEKPNGEDSPL